MSSMTLKLPNNYVEIKKDEIEYVDGGFAVSKNVAASIINVSIAGITGSGASALAAFISNKGKEQAKRIFTKTIINALASIGLKGIGASVGTAVEFALDYSNLGSAAATWLDAHDKYPNNGWIGW